MAKNVLNITQRIDGLIRFFLYVMIFWLPYSPAVIEVSVILCLVLWIVKRSFSLKKQETWLQKLRTFLPPETFLNHSIYLFLLACLISAIFGVTPFISFRGLLTKTCEWFVIFFLVIEVFKTRKHFKIALGIFLFTTAAVLVDGLVQFYWTHKDFFNGHEILIGGRAGASFHTPNGLGGYLTILLPLALSLSVLRWKKQALGFLFFVFFVFGLWTLVVSFSRGAWIGVFFGLGFFLLGLCEIKKLPKPIIFTLVIVFFVVTGLILSAFLFLQTDVQNLNRAFSAEWRLTLWKNVWLMIKHSPIFGYGLNTFMGHFRVVYEKYQGYCPYTPTYAHNCYLQLWAETGLLGLGLFLWIIILLVKKTHQKILKSFSQDRNYMLILLGLLSGLVAFLVHSFFDTNFYSLQLSAYMWLVIGFICAIYQNFENPINN